MTDDIDYSQDRHPAGAVRRRRRGVRPGARPRGPRRARHRHEDVLRLLDRVRRRAEHADLPDLPRPARLAAGAQRDGGRVVDPDRARAELRHRAVGPVRAEELLLPGHAEGLPDQPVRRADLRRRLPRRHVRPIPRPVATSRSPCGSRSSASTWRRTPASRCTSAAPPAASTAPTTRWSTTTAPASRSSRSSPGPSLGTGALAPEVAKAYVTELRDLLRSLDVSDVRMEQGSLRCDVNISLAPKGATELGHPHRDQERQLAALGRARGALRDRPARRGAARRRQDQAGDPPLPRGHRQHHVGPVEGGGRGLPLLPRARPGAGRARRASGSRSCARRCPRCPSVRRARLQDDVGHHRQGHGVDAQRRRHRPRRGDRRARRRPGRRPQVVDG